MSAVGLRLAQEIVKCVRFHITTPREETHLDIEVYGQKFLKPLDLIYIRCAA